MDFLKEISNVALYLSMEFGENWLLPINERLAAKYPNLSPADLDDYNELSKKVNQTGNNFVRENPKRIDDKFQFVDKVEFEEFMLAKFTWISTENLGRLYSQSCYYAMK